MQLKDSQYHNLGNLILPNISDPIGGSIPKFSNDDIKTENVPVLSKFSLSCPAQAYPVPGFRYIIFQFLTS